MEAIAIRSKDATRGSWHRYYRSKDAIGLEAIAFFGWDDIALPGERVNLDELKQRIAGKRPTLGRPGSERPTGRGRAIEPLNAFRNRFLFNFIRARSIGLLGLAWFVGILSKTAQDDSSSVPSGTVAQLILH